MIPIAPWVPPKMVYGVPVWIIKLVAAVVLAIGLFWFGWSKGSDSVQAEWDADKVRVAALFAAEKERTAAVSVETITRFVDRVRIIKGKSETIIQEVPVYVTAQADADCTINNGFVRVHDAASAGTLPPAPGDTDAAASAIKLSDVGQTVAENYGLYHEVAAQLEALQDWIKGVGGQK